MKNVLILPHQSYYMQAPLLFPEIRWFMLLCGYGAGKTKADVFSVLNDVKRLQGKKDRSGDYARLMVAGFTLSHLEKTFLIYFRQYLDMSKTPYVENKKYNTFKIGTVTIIMQPLENPGDIFGYDVHKIYVEEMDELTVDKMLEAARSLNERCRQTILGERPPSICLASTSQGQKGLYALYSHFKKTGVGFVLIRGRTEDNPYLPKELVRDMYKTYTPEEREVFMHGQFLSIAKGRVLPGFDWERNYAGYDLDQGLRDGETVMIGQDINCIAEGELVHTIRGDIPIERVIAGDLVLTRKGYKKVLTVFDYGLNMVSRCSTLYSTDGHIFRTPEGDKPQWQVKQNGNIYYLPKHESFRHRMEKTAEEAVLLVRELSSMDLPTLEIRDVKDRLGNILSMQKNVKCSIALFGNIIILMRRKGVIYTISMVSMIIGLNRLFAFLKRHIRPYIQETVLKETPNGPNVRQKKPIKRLRHGIKARKAVCTTVEYQKGIGWKGFIAVCVRALYVVKSLSAKFLPQKRAHANVGLNGKQNEGAGLGVKSEVLSILALNVEKRLEGLKKLSVAQGDAQANICGVKIQAAGGSDDEYLTTVYDLEVEDAHEYFVNGTLVHNTGYSRASAYVVRESVIYGIKYYDFADLMDAPKVFRHDFPTQKILWLPDVTIKDSFPAYSKELRKYGIKIIYRKKSPNVEDSSFLVSKLFHLNQLVICKIARDLAEACSLAMRDKDNRIPKGVGKSSPIHAIDGLRYVCTFAVIKYPGFENIRRLVVDKRASLRNEPDEELVKDLGSGYMEISPEAFRK